MCDLIVRENNLPAQPDELAKFVLFGEEKLNAVRAEISAMKKLNVAKEVVDMQLARAQDVAETVTLAKLKLGEIINALPKAGHNQYTQVQIDTAVEKQKPKAETIAELGISQKKAERLQTMAKNPEVVQAAMAKARDNADIVSEAQILNEIKQVKRKKDIQRQVDEIEQQALEKPDGLFDVIVIDPPWNYGTQFSAEAYRVANPYPEMTQAELKAIELPAAEDCVLFLWTTHKFIWDAKELLDHWGFDYRCMLVWNKQKLGTGNLIRMQCEFCLIGLKGKPTFKDVHNIRDLIEEPRREHSRKPDAFYQLVEELCAGRKLDYFSRQQREGWTTYGNDTDKFTVA